VEQEHKGDQHRGERAGKRQRRQDGFGREKREDQARGRELQDGAETPRACNRQGARRAQRQ
jgi:hypothetical protein